MDDSQKDTFLSVESKNRLKEEVLKDVAEIVRNDSSLKNLDKKMDEDLRKIINDTINFYSGVGVVLPAKQIATQILKTKLPQYKKGLEGRTKQPENDYEAIPEENLSYEATEKNQKREGVSNQLENYADKSNFQNMDVSGQRTNRNANNEKFNNTPTKSLTGVTNNREVPSNDNPQTNQESENIGQTSKTNSTLSVPKTGSINSTNIRETEKNTGDSIENSNTKQVGNEIVPPNQKKSGNLGSNIKNIGRMLSQNKTPQKLGLVTWIMLGIGAVIIDFAQDALAATVLALIANMLIDIVVGLSLFGFFWFKGIMDRRLAISLVLAFLIDFVSLGIMPAWVFDIAYAWFITDGAKVVSKIPGGGEEAEQLVKKLVSKKV
jgi:hypothetical protein